MRYFLTLIIGLSIWLQPALGRDWQDTVIIKNIYPNEDGSIELDLSVVYFGELKDNLSSLEFDIKEDSVSSKIRNISEFSATVNLDSIDNIAAIPVNCRIKLRANQSTYMGEAHLLEVKWRDLQTSETFIFGSPSNAINFSQYDWKELVAIGMIILISLLLVFSQLLPYISEFRFKKKFVVPYFSVKKANVTKYDPVTTNMFKDEDKVVMKCQTMTSYNSWKYNKFQCVNYPECMSQDPACTHGGASEVDYQFFNQRGTYKPLNWVWFGSLGGLFAWGLWVLLRFLDIRFMDRQLDYLIQAFHVPSGFDSLVFAFKQDILMGLCLGLGLGFMLAYVEEAGQSRRMSFGRIALRTLLAGFITPLLFAGGYYLQVLLALPEFWGGLLTWALFGCLLGLALSVQSTISPLRGFLGGLIASVVAFNIYFWLSYGFQAFEMARMLSFILLGGMLGLIIVSVVSRLEDFEIEIVAPEKFRRHNPVGRWLKRFDSIYIGNDHDCDVFIKWEDADVAARHARLSYHEGKVFLDALADTYVNRELVQAPNRVALKNGDTIQLGESGISQLRFWEQSSNNARPIDPNFPNQHRGGIYAQDSESYKKFRPKATIKISKR